MKRLLCVAMALVLGFGVCVASDAMAAGGKPQKCGNCGQNLWFMMECGEFSQWAKEDANCTKDYRCAVKTSLYTTLYVCPECGWKTSYGTHRHETEHTICKNELLCPFTDSYAVYLVPENLAE